MSIRGMISKLRKNGKQAMSETAGTKVTNTVLKGASFVIKHPIVIAGASVFALSFALVALIVGYDDDIADELWSDGSTNGGGSKTINCNTSPSQVEYACEQLKGGLAIPHYHQQDSRWANTWVPIHRSDANYAGGGSTYYSNGCDATSFAMVASYLLGRTIYPTEVVEKRGNDLEAWIQDFGLAADAFGIERPTHYSASDWASVKQAIKDGHPVIGWYSRSSTGVKPTFTIGNHFVVIRGMNSDGTFLVNDPSDGYDYYKNECYANRHFTEEEMQTGAGFFVVFPTKDCSTTS